MSSATTCRPSRVSLAIVANVLAAEGGPTYSQNSSKENPATRADDVRGIWEFGLS